MEDKAELSAGDGESEDVISCGATQHAIMSYEQDLIWLKLHCSVTCL